MKKRNRVIYHNGYIIKKIFGYSKEWIIIAGVLNILKGIITISGSLWILYQIMNYLESGGTFQQIVRVLLIFLLLITAYCTLNNWFSTYRQPILVQKVKQKLSHELMNYAKKLSLKSYENANTYDKFSLAKECLENTAFQIIDNFLIFLRNITMMVGGIISAVSIDPFLIVFVIFSFPTLVFGKQYARESGQMIKSMARPIRMKSYVVSTFLSKQQAKNIRTSKAGDLLRKYYKESLLQRQLIIKANQKKLTRLYFFNLFLSVDCIALVAYLYAIVRITISDNISIAAFSVLFSAIMVVVARVRNLISCYEKAARYSVDVENLIAFSQVRYGLEEDIIYDNVFHSITLKDVSFSYENELVLNQINVKIHEGQKIAIVGYNGAGKTTLVKLLLGFYEPTSGEIYLNNQPVNEYTVKERKRFFGVMFQDFHLFAISVGDNIAMSKDKDEDKILSSLRTANLSYQMSDVTREYGHLFDKNGIVPSGGQDQKIAFARLLYANRPIWIMDEPSAALDPLAEEKIYSDIMEEAKEKTVIFISHRLSSVKLVDRILFMKDGQIVEEGTHDILMAKGGEYAKLFYQQACLYNVKEANSHE